MSDTNSFLSFIMTALEWPLDMFNQLKAVAAADAIQTKFHAGTGGQISLGQTLMSTAATLGALYYLTEGTEMDPGALVTAYLGTGIVWASTGILTQLP